MKKLKEFVLEGVVDEICGDRTIVIFDVDGKDEKRSVETKNLRKADISHEGESFRLRIEEYQQDNGKRKTKTAFEPYREDTTQTEHIDLMPYLDTSKFRILD